MRCPTVKVKADNEQGFIIMNEDDFDSETHTLHESKKEAKAPAKKEAKK